MLRRRLVAVLLAGLCLSRPAFAQAPEGDVRTLLLQGAFADALQAVDAAGDSSRPTVLFDQGLAAFAVKDFERAAGLFAQVAQSSNRPDLAIRAAVAATMALNNNGDQANTCEYSGIVQPLLGDMPLLWRGWIEEARRANNCG